MGTTSGTPCTHEAARVEASSSSRDTQGGPRGGHVSGRLVGAADPKPPWRVPCPEQVLPHFAVSLKRGLVGLMLRMPHGACVASGWLCCTGRALGATGALLPCTRACSHLHCASHTAFAEQKVSEEKCYIKSSKVTF